MTRPKGQSLSTEPRTATERPGAGEPARRLNLGCGRRYVDGWTNVDLQSDDPRVIAHDLRKPLPFAEGTFAFVYSSHVLEHFDREHGAALVRESVRLLRPGGVLRGVVPDCELLTRNYLRALERAESGEENADADYDWSYLMLFDQAVRSRPGGQMGDYLRQERVPNREFVISSCGSEMAAAMDRRPPKRRRGLRKLFTPDLRKKLWRSILGWRYDAYRVGRFRLSGEVHLQMYDRYSLARLFRECGLTGVRRRTATESYWPGWSDLHLDVDRDGRVYKPESIYMEGVRE